MFELTFNNVSIFLFDLSFSPFNSLFEFTDVDFSIRGDYSALSLLFIIDKLAFIDWAIFVDENTIAMLLVIFPTSNVNSLIFNNIVFRLE